MMFPLPLKELYFYFIKTILMVDCTRYYPRISRIQMVFEFRGFMFLFGTSYVALFTDLPQRYQLAIKMLV